MDATYGDALPRKQLQHVSVQLNEVELAAVNEWRDANMLQTTDEALRALVRLGLLSEVAKVHRLVEDIRLSVEASDSDG